MNNLFNLPNGIMDAATISFIAITLVCLAYVTIATVFKDM